MTSFYLGTDRAHWLALLRDIPLFVSHRLLRDRKALPAATSDWCCDSGGFTELSLYGQWQTTTTQYVTAVRRYSDEIGRLVWAAPMDAMCEPWILEKSRSWLGGTVEAHQAWTVRNFLELSHTAADLPFIPVIQGWQLDDYHRHIDQYLTAGIDLTTYDTVGIGSVCRRQATTEIDRIVSSVATRGLRLHGFGIKTRGLALYGRHLVSADSMAWSFGGRYITPCPHSHTRRNCAHCLEHALSWRENVITQLETPVAAMPRLF